jgi:hypothetical protein
MEPMNEDKIVDQAAAVASAIFGATAVAFSAAWFYCIYYYVWTGTRQFNSALNIALLICLPAILAVCAVGALRLPPAARVSVAVLWSSTAVSMYALEALLTFWPWLIGGSDLDTAMRPQIAASFGVKFDQREVIEVLTDLQARGVDAVPTVYPADFLDQQPGGSLRSVIRIKNEEVLPLSGISNKSSVLCNENGAYTIYQSDEHGFHNPKGIWKSDRLDIAVVGDSFAHGFCVPSENNFVSLIRRHYPATLSLGMGGNGPLLELAAVKEFLPILKPRIVLWAYFEKNDWNELRNEARAPRLLQYLKPGFRQDLISRQNDLDQALLAYVEEQKPQALLRLRESRDAKSFDKLSKIAKLSALRAKLGLATNQRQLEKQRTAADEAADRALFRAVLQQAKTTVESWDGILYFVYLPPWERYAAPGTAKKNRETVLQMLASLKIPVIDVHASFQSHGDPLSFFPFRRSGHYNLEGNQVVAVTVIDRLLADRVLESP